MAALFDRSLGNLDSICDPSYHSALINIAALATANQTIEISNVPDPRLLKVEITRANGQVDNCTTSNQGISYDQPPTGAARIHFESNCARRADDLALNVKLLCAG